MTEKSSNWDSRPNRTSNGHKWRKIVKAVISYYGSVCIVCGHGGSDAADHLKSVREFPELEWEVGNLRPIHHNPCPVCSEASAARGGKPVRCNYVKGYGSLDTAKRIVAERTGLSTGKVSPETTEDSGWW